MLRVERSVVVAVTTAGLYLYGSGAETAAVPRHKPWRSSSPASPLALLDEFRLVMDESFAENLAGARVELWIDDTWLHWALVPWSNGQWSRKTLEAQSRMFVLAQQDSEDEDYRCAWEDATYGEPRMAVGLLSQLADGLIAHCAGLGVALDRVLPLGIGIWNALGSRTTAEPTVLMVSLPDHVVFVRGLGRVRQAVGVLARGGDQTPTEVLFGRLCLRDPAYAHALTRVWVGFGADADESASRIAGGRQVFDEAGSKAGESVPEALALWRRPPGGRGWRGLALAAGVAVLLGGVAALAMTSSRLEAESSRRAALARAQESSRLPVAPRVPEATIAVANQAVRQLNVPVVQLLKALRPPRDIPVFLLSVDLADSGRGGNTVRVAAEANTGFDMANYVGFLGSSLPFRSAWLVRHEETSPEKGGGQGLRFVVEAQWRE